VVCVPQAINMGDARAAMDSMKDMDMNRGERRHEFDLMFIKDDAAPRRRAR